MFDFFENLINPAQKNSKSKAIQMVNYFLFLGVGVFFIYLAFHGKDLNAIISSVLKADYIYAIPVLLFSILGLILRSLRWQMLIHCIDPSVKFNFIFHSTNFGYFVNYAIPRVGEIVRCLALYRKTNVPVTASFGTVMTERIADLVMLGICISLAFMISFSQLSSFFSENVLLPFSDFIVSKKYIFLALGGLIAFLFLRPYFSGKNKNENIDETEAKLDKLLEEILSGVSTLFKLKKWWLFLVYSIGIWTCYFFTSYIWFMAFSDTAEFGLKEGLIILVISTVGKSVPTQGGGMGAYHWLVAKGLMLLGINEITGNAYAIVNHGTQMVLQILLGSVSGIILFLGGRKKTK